MLLEVFDGIEGHGLVLNERATAHDFSQLAARFDEDLDVIEGHSIGALAALLALLVVIDEPNVLAVNNVVAACTGGEVDV